MGLLTTHEIITLYADTPKLKFDHYSPDMQKLYYAINGVDYCAQDVPEHGRKTFMHLYHLNANKAAIDYMKNNYTVTRVPADEIGSDEGHSRLVQELEVL